MKCPKCDYNGLIFVYGKYHRCGYCDHKWKEREE